MFSDAVRDRAREVVHAASAAHLTVGCAESCTGGLVSGALTAIPGSSVPVRGGIVSYAIAVKRAVLRVSGEVLDDPAQGAVSERCARQMSEGARRVLESDIAVSVTGIAGPGGEEPGKPVGTVWFGIASARGTRARLCHFAGNRDEVREQAVLVALELLGEEIVELSQ